MISRSGRMISAMLSLVMVAALLISCQSSTPTPTKSAGGNDVNIPVVQNDSGATAQPGSEATEAYPAGSQEEPVVENNAYPAGDASAVQPPADPNAAYPAANGAPALPNKAKVVVQFLEQKPGDSQDRVILRVKVISATPDAGSTDFVSKLVDQEVELMANVAGLPQLAPNDKFEAQVSYLGDENGGKYFADQVTKQ